VYSTLVTKLDILDRTINSLDAKAGVLIGATAAAFGLVVASVVWHGQSLPALRALARPRAIGARRRLLPASVHGAGAG